MIKALAIGLLLVYFWYFTAFPLPPVKKPNTPQPPSLTTRSFTHELRASGRIFRYRVNGRLEWTGSVPPGYFIHQGEYHTQDPCYNHPNGTKIPAKGKLLYDRLRHEVVIPKLAFNPNAKFVIQNGQVFYFTCKNKKIDRLEMCQPGHIFQRNECRPIDICTGRAVGTLLPDLLRSNAYYECLATTAAHRYCPNNNYFLHDACHSTKNMVHYCQFNTEPLRVDDFTVMRCRNKRPVIDKCPPKTQLFGTFRCESSECVGKANGYKIPMALTTLGPFQYSPGYIECHDNQATTHFCPSTWDRHLSEGDNLTHFPLVFNGQRCAVPSFCNNVTSDDPDVMVPVHEFTKHVKNWQYSELFDQVTGYKCSGNIREKRSLPPGQRINKKFKRENACDSTMTKVIISGQPDKYFDCISKSVQKCNPGQVFDSLTCRDTIPHAHTYNGIGLFSFKGLDHDGWIQKWYYSKNSVNKICQAPESEFIHGYNVCSHPDCAIYSHFLSQVQFPIYLKSGGYCKFENDRIIKYPSTQSVNFWSQRLVDNPVENEPCTVGQKVESGNFVVSSSLYATCDEEQPFVFCPSPLMTGIQMVENIYVCVGSNPLQGRLKAGENITIEVGEVKQIAALPNSSARIHFDKQPSFVISDRGYQLTHSSPTKLSTEHPLEVTYNYRVTYPPLTAYNEKGFVSHSPHGLFLMRTKKHTRKPVDMPSHHVASSVDHFLV